MLHPEVTTMSLPCSLNGSSHRSSAAHATTAVPTPTSLPEVFPKEQATIEAWYYNAHPDEDPEDKDPALAHRYTPDRPVPPEHLHTLGVLTWSDLDTKAYKQNAFLQQIKVERGYRYEEVATVAPGKMANYKENIKNFFKEHLHEHEEIRFILKGAGYEDVRDFDGQWIRIHIKVGDLIVLPPGMYHRFTLDNNYYIKAVLYYRDNPSRIQFDRNAGTDIMEVRKDYKDNVLSRGTSLNITSSDLDIMLDGLDAELAALKEQQDKEGLDEIAAMAANSMDPKPISNLIREPPTSHGLAEPFKTHSSLDQATSQDTTINLQPCIEHKIGGASKDMVP